jgi:exopolysaccharide biosynthesis polyprenyl glycosylphosphotransferase
MQPTARAKPIGWRLRSGEKRTILLIGDLLFAFLALAVALYLWSLRDQWAITFWRDRVAWWYYLLPFGWLLLLLSLCDPNHASNLRVTVRGIGIAALTGLLFYAVIYLLSAGTQARIGVAFFLACAAVLTLCWRLAYIRIFTAPVFLRRVLILGAGRAGQTLIRAHKSLRPPPFHVVGFIDDDPAKAGGQLEGYPVLATSDKMLEIVNKEYVTDLIIAVTGEMRGDTFQTVLDLQERGIEIVLMPTLYEELMGRVPIHHLESEWLIRSFVEQTRVSGFYELMKRLLDIVAAVIGLSICVVLYPLAAFVIWIDSGTPILYSQIRSGKGGKLYNIYKFRTMFQDAEKDGQARPAEENDARVTRAGILLRRTHIDELPQFWNVLRGEMSIVGPRAERPELIVKYQKEIPFYRARLLVKPGITGLAQVSYGYSATIAQTIIKIEYDLYYIKHRNLLMDLSIIMRTIGQVVGLRGR